MGDLYEKFQDEVREGTHWSQQTHPKGQGQQPLEATMII
jgi:hypothetical protein